MAAFAKYIYRLLKSLELIPGEIVLSRIVGRSEVRHQTVNSYVSETR